MFLNKSVFDVKKAILSLFAINHPSGIPSVKGNKKNVGDSHWAVRNELLSQLTFIRSKLTMKTLEQCVKLVQS